MKSRITFRGLRTISLRACIYSIAALIAVTTVQSIVAAELKPEPTPQTESKNELDKQLLDSLQNELLEGADEGAMKGEGPAADGASSEAAGEDIRAENEHPLSQIGARMRIAGEQIAAEKPGPKTRALHDQIVGDLEKLIRELEKECARCKGGGSPQNSQAQKSQRPSVKQSKGSGQAQSNQNSNKPARDSTTRVGKNDARSPSPEELTHLIRDVWGQLPERARQRLLQSPPEEFLPKYEVLIEKYYRRLAESPDEK